MGPLRRRWAPLAILAASAATVTLGLPPAGAAAHPDGYRQVDLVSDIPGRAQLTDPNLVNPWGIALGPTPLWVANNGTSTATVYTGANGSAPVTRVLVVKTSPSPTGQVFNTTKGFTFRVGGSREPSRFLFDTMHGVVSAWSNLPSPAPAVTDVAAVRGRVYLGLAVAATPDGPRLYAADETGGVDVFDGRFRLIATPHTFKDPNLPAPLTPYNVAVIGNRVYVSYASEEATTVKGAIDVFDFRGRLLRRLVTGGHLDGPWGMVVAPEHWGRFGGALLVGNEDDGRINAYNRTSGAFLGTLGDRQGHDIVNPGLWGLAFGNGIFGTPRDLIFAAGIDEYAHGLLGVIRPE